MNGIDLFLLRYNVLYDFWLYVVWEDVAPELMRQRPHPRVNSLAWNMWHLTRVEDYAVNRFITNQRHPPTEITALNSNWFFLIVQDKCVRSTSAFRLTQCFYVIQNS